MARDFDRQRKLERKAKKAAKRRQRTRGNANRKPLSRGASLGLDEAEDLLARGEYSQAVEVLEELARRYPRRPDILAFLAEAHLRAGDSWSYQAACARLNAADPNEPLSWLALASAALENNQVATAERAFGHLAAAWPDRPEAAEAREVQHALREIMADECRRRGLDEQVGYRVLLLHDEVNLHLHRGEFDRTCDAATRLLAMCPTFAPALNNRSEAHFRLARYTEAIADSRRLLEFDATNYHALANLTRYLYLSGQFDEARATAAALRACAASEADAFVKKAETFAVLGDWEAVHQAVRDGQKVWAEQGGTPSPAEHLAGVALANLGDLSAARRHWRRAAAGPNAVVWAKDNLEDSKRPAGKRHGPWAFPLEYWVPRGAVDDLAQAFSRERRAGAIAQIVQRHFEKYPQLELLASAILERSDARACEMVILLAKLSERPALLAALEKFALGQRGSDDLRLHALMALSKAERIAGEIEMWCEGTLRPVGLVSQEISSEPTTDLPPEINALMLSANDALRDGRGAEAQQLLDDVLRLRPDDVSAQFNRALAIHQQGREDQALQIVREIHRDHPDYVFARAHLADRSTGEGDLEAAKTLLAPIAKTRRLHTSEYAAWCSASINLALATGDAESARKLLGVWERIDPDDPRLEVWEGRIRRERRWLGRLFRRVGGRTR